MSDILKVEDLKEHIMTMDKNHLIIIINDTKESSDDDFKLSINDIMQIRDNMNTLVVYPANIELSMSAHIRMLDDNNDIIKEMYNLAKKEFDILHSPSMEKVRAVSLPNYVVYFAELILVYTDNCIRILKSRIFPMNTLMLNTCQA